MNEKRGKYTLEVPLDASGVGDLQPDEQQDLRVLAKDESGATYSTVVKVGRDRTATAQLAFDGPPGALTIYVGPATATDEELTQSQTITVDVGRRRWADRASLAIAPIVIAPYWWFWWLRWCREFVIRGRVVCPDGSPVPGASVCAFDVDWWFWWSSTQQVGCATTDVNGAFEIRFRWCCGYWPWWWWRNRVWTLDEVLAGRVSNVLAPEAATSSSGRIGNRPSLDVLRAAARRTDRRGRWGPGGRRRTGARRPAHGVARAAAPVARAGSRSASGPGGPGGPGGTARPTSSSRSPRSATARSSRSSTRRSWTRAGRSRTR